MPETHSLAALAARITAIEDRAAITDLVHAYAECVRNRTPAACVALFTSDAVVEIRHADPKVPGVSHPGMLFRGHAEILPSLDDTAGESARVWPMIHNLRIMLDGDAASSTCVMMSAIWPHGKEYVGEYRDTFRRVAGEWKFASRTYVVFGGTDGRYALDAFDDYVAAKGAIGDS